MDHRHDQLSLFPPQPLSTDAVAVGIDPASSVANNPIRHDDLISDEAHDIMVRAHWQTAKSVDHVDGGRHQYCVYGWSKDDLTTSEFMLLVNVIKEVGRAEEWTAPEGFYDSGKRPRYRNKYLYVGEFAYWVTRPPGSRTMINRERLSVQAETPTRRVLG